MAKYSVYENDKLIAENLQANVAAKMIGLNVKAISKYANKNILRDGKYRVKKIEEEINRNIVGFKEEWEELQQLFGVRE